MGLDILKPCRYILDGLALAIDKKPFPETEPADAAADIGQEKQAGLGIFVLEAREFCIIFLAGRVQATPAFEFAGIGNDDPAERVVPVFPVNQGQVIVIGTEGKRLADRFHILPLLGLEPDEVVELVN